eukprot:1623867-Pyramimonas_sp.AAC.1
MSLDRNWVVESFKASVDSTYVMPPADDSSPTTDWCRIFGPTPHDLCVVWARVVSAGIFSRGVKFAAFGKATCVGVMFVFVGAFVRPTCARRCVEGSSSCLGLEQLSLILLFRSFCVTALTNGITSLRQRSS